MELSAVHNVIYQLLWVVQIYVETEVNMNTNEDGFDSGPEVSSFSTTKPSTQLYFLDAYKIPYRICGKIGSKL